MSERARTVEAVAARIHVQADLLRSLLREDAQRGIVQCDEHGEWELTESARRRFGAALGEFRNGDEGSWQ